MADKSTPRKKKAEEQAAPAVEEAPEAVLETPFDQFIEHQRRALVEAGKALEILLIPPGVKEHGTAALKEAAEGFQKLINAACEEFDNATAVSQDSDESEN